MSAEPQARARPRHIFLLSRRALNLHRHALRLEHDTQTARALLCSQCLGITTKLAACELCGLNQANSAKTQ